MTADDVVSLGRTVPEESKKYGYRVCFAGYRKSTEELIRVYPLMVQDKIPRRSTSCFSLVRNPSDSREESWKLEDGSNSIQKVSSSLVPMPEVTDFLLSKASDSIQELNQKRRSLGVIVPKGDCVGLFKDPEERDDSIHKYTGVFGSNSLRRKPYIRFTDCGGVHEIQYREWGAYIFCIKHPGEEEKLWDANTLNLNDGMKKVLVVGNMCNRRNVWLIIGIFTPWPKLRSKSESNAKTSRKTAVRLDHGRSHSGPDAHEGKALQGAGPYQACDRSRMG